MDDFTIFANRRQKIAGSMPKNSALILASAKQSYRNRDVEYPFRQDSDFYYLTGFEEPNAILLLIPGRIQGEYILFNQVRDPEMETWNGPRAGQEGAVKDFGADEAFPIDELDEKIIELLRPYETIYYSFGDKTDFTMDIIEWCKTISSDRRAESTTHQLLDIDPILHEMRLFKSEYEIECMKKAAQISVAAHKRAMQFVKSGQFEYEVEAEILHECIRQGCREQAYGAIVGSGAGSCILHYVANNAQMKAGDLLLIDAGAEYKNYASDITRTFPVSGKFTEEQKQIYSIVLDAQQSVIDAIKPGVKWDELQKIATRIICRGLVEIGLLEGEVKELIESEAVKQFYMHGVSHWLGLDVHDVGNYKVDDKWRAIEPGMVFTVEPGIYIAEQKGVDKKWWNIGVRIEDDVLVTKDGCEVLTDGLPKTILDIEKLMEGG